MLNNEGTIKEFASLAEARKWLQMPAPRMFYEKTGRKDVKREPVKPGAEGVVFAVQGGTKAGVYSSMADAIDAKESGGGTLAVFVSADEADKFVARAQFFVVWAGRSVGVMDQHQCIAATQRLEDAKMRGPLSETLARELWASLQSEAKIITSSQSGKSTAKKKKKKKKSKKYFYAVAIGKVPGVYDEWKEAEKQVKGVRPNLHSKFESKKQAQAFVDANRSKGGKAHRPPSPTASVASAATSASRKSSVAESDNGFDDDTESEAQSQQGTASLSIETPSIEELEQAEADGKVRVFACHTDVGTARIAVSFDKAIANVRNPEVQVINSESTLLDNLAVAEVRLRADTSNKRKTLSDRLAEARARAGASSHAQKRGAAAASPRASSSVSGKSGSGLLVNRSAVGRAKETQMIQHFFVDHPEAISVAQGSEVPFPHELDDDMDLPNTKAIFNVTAVKDLTITDFYKAKEKAISSFPLLDFQEFMRICRKAQRMCQASKKSAAVANAAALGELIDICLRVHRTYDRMGTLGRDEIRFKARMFLHLQYACMHRVVHAGAMAMSVFESATDPFCSRLPEFSKSSTRRSPGKTRSGTDASQPESDAKMPLCGCYLCPATDHFCSNRKFHPMVNGKYEPVSDETKAAIMTRIENSPLAHALKDMERKNVKRFWSQHGL